MTRRRIVLSIAVAIGVVSVAAGARRFLQVHRAAAAKECIDNLRRIDAAKNQWAMETIQSTNPSAFPFRDWSNVFGLICANQITNVTPSGEDIHVYLSGDMKMPSCPSGGTYTMGRIGELPKCSVPGHSLNRKEQ